MNENLVKYPSTTIIMPPALFAPIEWWAKLAAYGTVVIDDTIRYDKRYKQVHRYDIADVRGRLSLTVPVVKPTNAPGHAATWHDVAISTHGNWWHVHRITLESAYGRTPFFEFYVDRLARFFDSDTPERYKSVAALNRDATLAVASILGLDNKIVFASDIDTTPVGITDNQHTESQSCPIHINQPYYQVRHNTLGFIANLSILDLIFNLGTEAPLHLRLSTT